MVVDVIIAYTKKHIISRDSIIFLFRFKNNKKVHFSSRLFPIENEMKTTFGSTVDLKCVIILCLFETVGNPSCCYFVRETIFSET